MARRAAGRLILAAARELAVDPAIAAAPDGGPFLPFTQALSACGFAAPDDVDGAVSPRLAAAWAGAILRYWIAARAGGRLVEREPLLVLDLHPRSPRLAAWLLPALRRGLVERGLRFRVGYIACGVVPEEAARFREHPDLIEFNRGGWFSTADLGRGGIALHGLDVVIERTVNPIALLAFGSLGSAGVALHAVHHGGVLAGEARVAPHPDEPGASSLAYRFHPAASPESSPAAEILAHYRAVLNSAPLLVPTGALGLLDALSPLSGDRYLLLAADRGVASEAQLRLGALRPPASWHPEESFLPFDFCALAHHQRARGALAYTSQLDETFWTLHVALRDGEEAPDEETFASIVAGVEAHHPAEGPRLLDLAAGAGSPAAALALLRLSGHDPAVLDVLLPRLLESPGAIDEAAVPAWKEAIERAWDLLHLDPAAPRLPTGIGLFAAQLGHFGLARGALSTAIDCFGASLADLHGLARVEAATARPAEALALVETALAHAPDAPELVALKADLDARLARRARLPYRDQATLDDDDLQMEPLGPEHAAALLHQYRDPQIAEMTRLPPLATPEDVCAFIVEQVDQLGEAHWAVVHRDSGFAGVVCLKRNENAGFFYFWMGVDFQCRGYGTRAARMALAQAGRMGLGELFTIAYSDNVRSLRVLRRMGFVVIDERVDDQGDAVIVLHRPAEGSGPEDNSARLARYEARFGPIISTPSPR